MRGLHQRAYARLAYGCDASAWLPLHKLFQKRVRIVLLALLAIVVSLSLAGCRDSDVLTQKIIDAPGVSEIDYSLDPVRTDAPESDREDIANIYEQESQSQDHERQQNQPEYQQDNPTTDQTADQQPYSSTVNPNGQATEGGKVDGSSGDAADPSGNEANQGSASEEGDGNNVGAGNVEESPVEGSPEQEPNQDQPESPAGQTIRIETPDLTDEPQPEDDSPSPEQGQNAGSNDNTWSPSPSGNGGGTGEDKQGSTYADGTYDTIPSAGKVAAAGPYATIVQSLGGRGALAAAPQQWLDNLPSGAYDNGNELIDVKGIAAWGDGEQMTDAAVQGIIDSGADVVLTSSTYNVMNQDQANALNAAGVDVLVVPDIGTTTALDADIVMTVDVIGELLKDAGTGIQFDAKQAAAVWKSMHNSTLQTCLGNNGGYSCASWGFDNAYIENYLYQGSFAQAESSRIGYTSLNNLYTVYVNGWDAASDNGYGNPSRSSIARSSFDLIDYYFQHSGLQRGGSVVSFNGTMGGYETLTAYLKPSLTSTSQEILNGNGHSTPIVITRDEQTALNVAQSAKNSSSDYNFGYDYTVYVMPGGVDGSWDDGTFESFLVAPWAYSIAREHGTAQADQFVNKFYLEFYRSDASGLVDGYGTKVVVECGS